MEKEIEIFEHFENKYNIEGINLQDLKGLLSAPINKQGIMKYKNYFLKPFSNNNDFFIINDGTNNLIVSCVKDYYNFEFNNCLRITDILDTYNEIHENYDLNTKKCETCHLKCLKLLENNKIKLKSK